MPHVATAVVLFIHPKVHWFWIMSYSLIFLLKNYVKKKLYNHLFISESKTGIFKEQWITDCPCQRKEIVVFHPPCWNSSLLSLPAHKDTWTSCRHFCSNAGNKAASLVQCAVKSSLTCLWAVTRLYFLPVRKPACCLHPKSFIFHPV